MSESKIPQTGQQQERKAAEQAAAEKESRGQELRAQRESTPRGPLQTSRGATTPDETVVAKIAGMAAREGPGVYDMGNAVRRGFSAVPDRIPHRQTNLP